MAEGFFFILLKFKQYTITDSTTKLRWSTFRILGKKLDCNHSHRGSLSLSLSLQQLDSLVTQFALFFYFFSYVHILTHLIELDIGQKPCALLLPLDRQFIHIRGFFFYWFEITICFKSRGGLVELHFKLSSKPKIYSPTYTSI